MSLPDAAAARLELVDASGRSVLVRDVGGLGAGTHSVRLEPPTLCAGIYWLALVRMGERRSSKVVVTY